AIVLDPTTMNVFAAALRRLRANQKHTNRAFRFGPAMLRRAKAPLRGRLRQTVRSQMRKWHQTRAFSQDEKQKHSTQFLNTQILYCTLTITGARLEKFLITVNVTLLSL